MMRAAATFNSTISSLSYFCDPEQREMLPDRGDDPDKQPTLCAASCDTATARTSPPT